jgi:hypothetical protein
MPYPNDTADETLMMLRAQQQNLPTDIIWGDVAPIGWHNDGSGLKVWAWNPKKTSWERIQGNHHPPHPPL